MLDKSPLEGIFDLEVNSSADKLLKDLLESRPLKELGR